MALVVAWLLPVAAARPPEDGHPTLPSMQKDATPTRRQPPLARTSFAST